MQENKEIIVSIADGIATIVLNKPEKRNALDTDLVQEFLLILKELAADTGVNIIILRAAGPHFCAGADIASMHKMAKKPSAENIKDAQLIATLLYQIYTFAKPVIALVHGATFGGGLGLAAAADIVLAANNATFCFSEVKIGLAPSIISPYIIKAIGERAAKYYFLTASKFDAQDGFRLGLVHQIVEPENLVTLGLSLARELQTFNQVALSETKSLTQRVVSEPITKALSQLTAEHLAKMRSTAAAEEGFLAFLEKRMPKW
jgi:methylglutaconyl-CoA hydratase